MSWSLHILADTEVPLEEFAGEVGRLLGMALQRESDDYEVSYRYSGPDVYLIVSKNDFENDQGLAFEDYRYDIALWPHRRPRFDETIERWRSELAPTMFEKLKSTGRYHLMLVEGVQTRLDEHHPDVRSAP